MLHAPTDHDSWRPAGSFLDATVIEAYAYSGVMWSPDYPRYDRGIPRGARANTDRLSWEIASDTIAPRRLWGRLTPGRNTEGRVVETAGRVGTGDSLIIISKPYDRYGLGHRPAWRAPVRHNLLVSPRLLPLLLLLLLGLLDVVKVPWQLLERLVRPLLLLCLPKPQECGIEPANSPYVWPGNGNVEPPLCPLHASPMKPSNYGGWFCSRKHNGAYCTQKA